MEKQEIRDLIPIADNNGQQAVNARHLYDWLEIKKDFTNWMKAQISRCDLTENVDYQAVAQKVESKNGIGYTIKTDYALSLNAAKEISMMSQTEKGKQARRYFIECERIAKEAVQQQHLLPSTYKDALKQLLLEVEEKERLQLENQEKQVQLEEKEYKISLQEKEIKEAAPKVQYFDQTMQSTNTLTTTQVAKSIGMEAWALNKKLEEIGIQFKQSCTWMLRSPYSQWGLHSTRTTTFTRQDGTVGTETRTVWKEKGRMFIVALSKNNWNITKTIDYIKGQKEEETKLS